LFSYAGKVNAASGYQATGLAKGLCVSKSSDKQRSFDSKLVVRCQVKESHQSLRAFW
jgi:hypothetical protein